MSYIYVGKKPAILWGSILRCNLPQLPPGYIYISIPQEWLLVEGPGGRRYYVSGDGGGWLFRQVITPKGRFGCDDSQWIELPQKQLM